MAQGTCPKCVAEGDGDEQPLAGRGMCRKHYLRAYRAGEFTPGRPGPEPQDRRCSVLGCGKRHKGFGYCRKHLNDARREGLIEGLPDCSFEGCGKEATTHDLCLAHRRQQLKGQPLRPLRGYTARTGTCPGPECDKPIHSGGYCSGHYWQAHEGLELTPIVRDLVPRGTPCWVLDGACGRPSLTRDGLCRAHYDYRRSGDPDWQRPVPDKAANGAGHTDADGYRIITVGGRPKREHVHIFEQLIGRALLPGETVHHIRGDRSDNRTDGPPVLTESGKLRSGLLELWSSAQPAGQEIGPKVDWALEILETYGQFLDAARRERLRDVATSLAVGGDARTSSMEERRAVWAEFGLLAEDDGPVRIEEAR